MAEPRRPERALSLLPFYAVAVLVGVVAGIGAVVFRALIGLFHNALFLRELSWVYDANLHTAPSPWGPLVVLVPVVGAAAVALLVQNFAPEAKGHGVPEVVDAIHYNRGVIRPVVALIKSLASALSIGSGGSVGREGPIIQIGSAFGSSLGQALRVPGWQRVALIAAGAGGGIAATFNTPVGGVLFAVEIVMQEVSARTLVPVAIATATATYVGRLFFGTHPSFVIPDLELSTLPHTDPGQLLLYVGLGVLLGLASVAYIRSLYAFEDFFEERVPGGYVLRHMLGMACVGLLFYGMLRASGHYYLEGVGYATVQDVLNGTLASVPFLLLLCALKLLATSLTLGSGASGGVFSPGLFMGATLGAGYAGLAGALFPGLAPSAPAFAVAGMAGMIGGSTGAALAAIVMIFEMTLDYAVIIPITISVALAYGVRRLLLPDSIYSMKLTRRGHFVPDALRASPHELRRASDVMDANGEPLDARTSVGEAARRLTERSDLSWFLLREAGEAPGIATRADVLAALGESGAATPIGRCAQRDGVRVAPEMRLLEVLERLRKADASLALVVEAGAPLTPESLRGVISRSEIGRAVLEAAAVFQD